MSRSMAMVTVAAGAVLFAGALGRSIISAQEAKPKADDPSRKALEEQKASPVQVITRTYDVKKLRTEPKVAEPVYRGRILWVQRCAYCHDGLGQPTYKTMGPWVDQELVKVLTEKFTRDFIMNGDAKMPGFKYNLNPGQLDDLMTFLKTVPASDKPTPAQLAGRGEGVTASD